MTTNRLYVSPLTPSLLNSIIPPTTPPAAANVSFHGIETFPEKSYGYIDISVEEAQRLKKKLNGSFLRGMKVRVEDARPEKRKRKAEEEVVETSAVGGSILEIGKASKQSKRAKREKRDGVLPAVELPTDRQVKRGWVEKGPEDKQKQHKKSKDGEKKRDKKVDRSQMLFRAQLPPNVASRTAEPEKKSKKSKKKSENAKTAVEVKEFEKTTKYPTFLRNSKSSAKNETGEYIDGKGWVDANGDVVESERPGSRRKKVRAASTVKKPSKVLPPESPETADSDSTVSSVVSSDSDSKASSLSDDDEDDDDEAQSREITAPSSATSYTNVETSTSDSSSAKLLKTSALPRAITPSEAAKEVHPLEALFKRPAPTSPTNTLTTSSAANLIRSTPRPAPIVTSFNFFDSDAAEGSIADEEQGNNDADDASGIQLPQVPVTPFTRRDLEARGQRSAAPTPDTAAVGKRLRVPWMPPGTAGTPDPEGLEEDELDEDDEAHDDEDDDEGEGDDTFAETTTDGQVVSGDIAGSEKGKEQEQTEFEKHFWANRGEYNRSWKARKREARKEARQADNRRTGRAR